MFDMTQLTPPYKNCVNFINKCSFFYQRHGGIFSEQKRLTSLILIVYILSALEYDYYVCFINIKLH